MRRPIDHALQALLIALLTVPSAAWPASAADEQSFDSQAGGRAHIEREGDQGSIDKDGTMAQRFTVPSASSDIRVSRAAEPSTPTAVPEPRAAAMWLVGLAAFGFIALRRTRR